jgi:NAD(P)-dependent dehydrogenase (short-subunit alcohol dehydrogenase family)
MRLQLRDCRGRSDTRDDQVFGALLENTDVIAGRLAAKYGHRIGLLAQAPARVFAEELMLMSTSDSPVWLITGCSTGFGREFARAAITHGFRVVATARDARKLDDLVIGHEEHVRVLTLDVTNSEHIKSAVNEAERAFGRIDVLVNNAGYGYMAAVEEGEEKDIRALFETNFFGLAAMIRAVLPGMRARRQGSIVNIASVGGIIGFPGSGYYAATKFAVEGLSQSLAREVEPLGIRVLLVEPGPFRTDWAGRSLRQSPNFIGDYEQTSGHRRREIASYSGKQPGDPVRAALAVIKVMQSPAPPAHLVLGREGIDNVERHFRSMLSELELWRETSVGADFPR